MIQPVAHVPLAGLTTLGVGGPAAWCVDVHDAGEVAAADDWCRDRGVPLTVVGGGSNVVVADRGVDGLVVRVAIRGLDLVSRGDDCSLRAGAGEVWDGLVARLVSDGWAGVECLSGIPGTVGGTPIQNVGAYGQDVGGLVTDVEVYDRETRDIVHLTAAACGFAYRHSRFKGADAQRFVVCRVGLALRRGPATATDPDIRDWLHDHGIASPTLSEVRRAVVSVRRRKGMVVDPADADSRSVGSFFMNPVVSAGVRSTLERMAGVSVPARKVEGGWRIPAAWLIERAGWSRGDADGAVGLSTKHPLAIVNRGGATASAVVRFAAAIKRRVIESTGVSLRPEPVFLGFGADEHLEYLHATHQA
jgi:UDP-N-acetylmuramate dehydrogenase